MTQADTCSRCGLPVRTVFTLGGKVRDLECDPDPNGNHVLIEDEHGHGPGGHGPAIRARVLTGVDAPPDSDRYRMHTCPPRPPSGPRCRTCKSVMDSALAALEQWETHPCCDPEYRADLATARRRKMSAST